MGEEPKKISFGFSKISKKPPVILPQKKEDENEIQFIDSLEGNSIKLINGEEEKEEVLVIPLRNANALRDNMVEALKARREERLAKQFENKSENENLVKSNVNEVSEEKPLTLDELAAKEILEDLKKKHDKEEESVREIPTTNITSLGEKESTLEDYENVPVQEFGLAVLRGMGWAPNKGIGKTGQVVLPVNPVVRPKGMGLGADKAQRPSTVAKNGKEELVLKKGAFLKIINGQYKNLYGKVEGFDELPGRLMVRLTIQNNVISISENLIVLVSLDEYNQNSKILNLNEYQTHIAEEDSKKGQLPSSGNKVTESKPAVKRMEKLEEPLRKSSNYQERKISDENFSRKCQNRARSISPASKNEYKGKIERKSPSRSGETQESSKKSRNNKEKHVARSPDERYSRKNRPRAQTISSESEDESRKKIQRKTRSSSRETEARGRKSKKERYKKSKERDTSSSSESKDRIKKSKKSKRSPSSSDEEGSSKKNSKKKSQRKDRSPSSSEDELRRKKKKKSKESRNRHDASDSSPERSRHKKHREDLDLGRSRSPSVKKKKKRKQHRRSHS